MLHCNTFNKALTLLDKAETLKATSESFVQWYEQSIGKNGITAMIRDCITAVHLVIGLIIVVRASIIYAKPTITTVHHSIDLSEVAPTSTEMRELPRAHEQAVHQQIISLPHDSATKTIYSTPNFVIVFMSTRACS